MKAYKVFNNNWMCKDYDFKSKGDVVGSVHLIEGELQLCVNGFHFCRTLSNCFNYYSFSNTNKVAEIEVLGDIIGDAYDKECTNKFRIVKELTWGEVLTLCNSGDRNSGNRNSGDYNSGDRNSGDRNSGDYNSGDYNSGNRNSGNLNSGNYNSGDLNSGNYNSGNCNSGNRNSGNYNSGNYNSGNLNSGNCNSGFFNSITPDDMLVFNKTVIKRSKFKVPSWCYFDLTQWVSYDTATDYERIKYKEKIEICGGFLKNITYKEAFKRAWDNSSIDERKQVLQLPGFDKEVFYEISGIDVYKDM